MKRVIPLLLLATVAATPPFEFALRDGLGDQHGRALHWLNGETQQPDPWAERLEDEGAVAHAKMSAWLRAFYAATPPEDLAPSHPPISAIHPRKVTIPPRSIETHGESSEDPRIWAPQPGPLSCDALLEKVQPLQAPDRRRHLIIAPVGDGFNASRWMTHPRHATYDIIALYYGNNTGFSCELCAHVMHAPGTKWYLTNKFVRENVALWSKFSSQYDSVMVADDDVIFDTCVLNRAFEVFSAYNLLLGQPSLCRTPFPATYWHYLYQEAGIVLRYVSFIEIMAPIFRMDFFQHVVTPSLWNAFTGWGLDFTWPFLLRYPRRHVGVVDEVCMVHDASWDKRTGQASLYAVPVPYDEREEETRRVAEYGYYASRVEAMGFVYRNMETLGIVLPQSTTETVLLKKKQEKTGAPRQSERKKQKPNAVSQSKRLEPDVVPRSARNDVQLLVGHEVVAVMGVMGGFSAAILGSWIRKKYLQSHRFGPRRASKR